MTDTRNIYSRFEAISVAVPIQAPTSVNYSSHCVMSSNVPTAASVAFAPSMPGSAESVLGTLQCVRVCLLAKLHEGRHLHDPCLKQCHKVIRFQCWWLNGGTIRLQLVSLLNDNTSGS